MTFWMFMRYCAWTWMFALMFFAYGFSTLIPRLIIVH